MFFPGNQPRVSDFRFRCIECGAETSADTSNDGRCALCAGSAPAKRIMERMTREELKRRKRARKILHRVRRAKRADQSTMENARSDQINH